MDNMTGNTSQKADGTFYDETSPQEESQNRLEMSPERLPTQGSTGPVGEPGLPPSRPVSTATEDSAAAAARAGVSSSRRPFSGARGSWNDPSRPETATSRTHIPNLTSPSFFNPMSSRKQREESQRPMSPPVAPLPETPRKSTETSRSARRHKHRYSNASVVTIENNQRPLVDSDAPPVPASRDGNATQADIAGPQIRAVRSQGSNVPLRQSDQTQVDSLRPDTRKGDKSPKSPRSFRHSFGLSRPTTRGDDRKPNGHKRLDSGPSSPPSMAAEKALAQRRPQTAADTGRNYEYYNGNAIFFLGGRLLNARQRPLNALTGFLALLPAALFFAFSASYLWHNVSPAIPILFAYIFWICISSYSHASFSDPGILPRNLHPHPPTEADNDLLAVGPSTSDWVTVKSFGPAASKGQSTAMEVPTKYCKSCNIWRPPRAHHCRICDACIETQDHHCVWLNNCVGRRNYRQFFTFVASGSLLALFLLAASLAHLLVYMNRQHISFGKTISSGWQQGGALAMLIYGILVFPYPASLMGYHVFLMARGESTREYLNSHKFLKRDRHRPFSQNNVFRNLVTILGRPRTPTYMRFKSRHDVGDQKLGDQRRRDRRRPDDLEKGGMEMKNLNGKASPGFQGPRNLNGQAKDQPGSS